MEVRLLSITPDAEKLIEKAGRTCYLSFEKTEEGSEGKFIRMLIRCGHTSVLEHAYATFRIRGCSRSFTHQLVRHRLCSFSQQSQRHVNEENFTFVVPEKIKENVQALKLFNQQMEKCRNVYIDLQKIGIPNEDARFVLPNACASEIVFSANFRELRHIFQVRGAKNAQWEIRKVAVMILKIMKEKAPSVFEDLIVDEKKGIVKEVNKSQTKTIKKSPRGFYK